MGGRTVNEMTRLEALDLCFQLDRANKAGDLLKCLHLLGFTDEIAEHMSPEDIRDATQVRVADILRRAGFSE